MKQKGVPNRGVPIAIWLTIDPGHLLVVDSVYHSTIFMLTCGLSMFAANLISRFEDETCFSRFFPRSVSIADHTYDVAKADIMNSEK